MRKHSARPWTLLLLGAIVTLTMASPRASLGAPREGGEAAMAIFGSPGSVLLQGLTTTNFAVTVYQSANRALIRYNPNLRMEADMAEKWSVSPDGKTYTFTIRKDAKWSDGAPITSRDFQFSVDMIAAKETIGNWFIWVDQIVGAKAVKRGEAVRVSGLRIVDPQTFQVQIEEASATFLDLFGTELMPMPRHKLQTVPPAQLARSEFARVPSVSSGPFYVAGYQTDAQVELRRNPHYFGRKPALERVFIKILTPEVAIAQLERGELQIIPGEISGELPPPEVARLRRNSAIQVTSYPNNNTEVIYPNLKNRPLDDVRIRQAMMYALDRESIVGTALLGMGKVAYSPVPAFAPYYNKDINTYRHNPDRARQLLREAGYAGQRIRFIIPTGDTTRQTVGTIAHQLWTAVGLNVVIEQMDFPTAVGRLLRTRDYDLAIVQNRGFNNPDLSRRFHTSGIATGVNAGQYANPEMDRLLEQARTTVDFKDQKPLLFKVQELAMRDLPVFLLYYRDSIGAVNTQQLGGAVPRFGGVHKDMANWYRK